MGGFINIYQASSHPGKSLYNHIKEIVWFSEELKNLEFNFNEKYLKILAVFHDIGKMYKPYQEYLKGKGKKIKHSGPSSVLFFLTVYNKEELLEKLKLKELVDELRVDLDLSKEEIKVLTYLILVHHSDLKIIRAGEKTSNHYENFFTNFYNPWEKYLKEYNLLNDYINTIATKIDIKNTDEFLNTYAVFKISDRLSASFHRELKREEISGILSDFGILNIDFELNEEKLNILLKSISNRIDENRLKDQIRFIENRINILLAPTGFGKTTFSIFKGINKNSRFLIALPTITAIKQFLGRTKKIIKEIKYPSEVVGTYFYFYNPFTASEEDEALILNEYFLSRYLLKPIMITTIDQLLLTYLQTKEYYIKRFALQNRLLIIDEVHLLSPKMLYFLLQFLKEYKHLFKDYIFMSATFPRFLREIIQSELNISEDNVMLLYNYYPKSRIWIELLDDICKIKKDKKEEIFEKIYEQLVKLTTKDRNSRIIVLFNIVNNAQEFYEYLKSKDHDWDILLFHSRYTYKHREEIEKRLLDISKKKDLKRPFILIATQVVEVSLDIDFDYLITELAPLPELIQRFGRVYRNRKYPKDANIYIFGFLEESTRVYSEKLMYTSYEIIKDFIGIVDEEKLVKQLDINEEYKTSYLKEFEHSRWDYSKLLNKWLNDHANRFYYLFTEEDEEVLKEISKLLNIRESINTLVFVNEKDLEKNDEKEYLELIEKLEKSRKEKKFVSFFKAKLKLRGFLIPVPFYYIKPLSYLNEGGRIPVLPSGVYNKEIGLDVKKIREKLELYVEEDIIL